MIATIRGLGSYKPGTHFTAGCAGGGGVMEKDSSGATSSPITVPDSAV